MLALAEPLRAEPCLRLGHHQPVAPAEQREQVVRIVLDDRERAALGWVPGQDRGNGERGRGGHGRGVAEPDRAAGQAGEVRETAGVDLALRVLEVDYRKLVEEEEDD